MIYEMPKKNIYTLISKIAKLTNYVIRNKIKSE